MEPPTELIELADELCSQIAEYGKPAVQTIAAALLAERLSATERAAKIAEDYGNVSTINIFGDGQAEASASIAAAIRSQP